MQGWNTTALLCARHRDTEVIQEEEEEEQCIVLLKNAEYNFFSCVNKDFNLCYKSVILYLLSRIMPPV